MDVPYGDHAAGLPASPGRHRRGQAHARRHERSDGSLPGLLGYGAAEALQRGWNAFVFDGPGQHSMLFERGVPFRHNWETVPTPVIDVCALITMATSHPFWPPKIINSCSLVRGGTVPA
jgi:hypothetical protein